MAPDAHGDMTDVDSRAHPRPAFVHVAVLCRETATGLRWGSRHAQDLASRLTLEGLILFTYFPVRFEIGADGADIESAFLQIAEQQAPAYDAILVVGGHDLATDIGIIHRVLVPNIASAKLPVLTALGPDDNDTVIGDTAYRSFADPLALLSFVAKSVEGERLPADEILHQIRSLGHFLVAELAVESKILMDAALRPAVQRCVEKHESRLRGLDRDAERIRLAVQLRLMRDEAAMENTRVHIGKQLSRLIRLGGRKTSVSLWQMRIAMLLAFAGTVVLLWLYTSPAATVFFSGCVLVVLSAAYVSLSNRILDQSDYEGTSR